MTSNKFLHLCGVVVYVACATIVMLDWWNAAPTDFCVALFAAGSWLGWALNSLKALCK